LNPFNINTPNTHLLSHQVIGAGHPYLVLPGFGMTNWLFREIAERLSHLAQFILIDNRGTGANPPSTGDYNLRGLAEDALQLADQLDLERFGVIGISMGGIISQELFHRQPERISRMVFMCTLGPGNAYLPPPTFEEAALRELYSGDIEPIVRSMVTATVHPSLAQRNPERIEHIVQQRLANRVPVEELIRQQRAVMPFFKSENLEQTIDCPLLILTGEQDRVVPLANAQRLAASHPQTQLTVFPKSDHLFFLERPREVAQRLSIFLEQP
jgi:pimeloyl-ACP methyl ester carboxylesterase